MVSSHAIVLMWEKCNWEKNESKKPFADFGTLNHHSLSHDLLKFYERAGILASILNALNEIR